MHIAILTFDGFNELDSLIALGVLHRIKKPDWRVTLCCPTAEVTSMNGVTVRAQSSLEDARAADAVVVGSGMRTREMVDDPALNDSLPTRRRDPDPLAELTDRDRDGLALRAYGLTARGIGERLWISTNTVETHIRHILQKLDLHSDDGKNRRVQAVLIHLSA